MATEIHYQHEMLTEIARAARAGDEQAIDHCERVLDGWIIDESEAEAIRSVIELARDFVYEALKVS